MAIKYFEDDEANSLFASLQKKHQRFLLEYLKDHNASRAYRDVFNPKDSWSATHASRLVAFKPISQILEYYYKQHQVPKERLTAFLVDKMDDVTLRMKDRLSSCKLLAQINGYLQDKEVNTAPTSINVTLAPQHGHELEPKKIVEL